MRPVSSASVGGVGSARGVAGLYAAALTGFDGKPPLLQTETIGEFSAPYLTGPDLVTGDRDAFGLGFERPATEFPGGTAPENGRLIQALLDAAARSGGYPER